MSRSSSASRPLPVRRKRQPRKPPVKQHSRRPRKPRLEVYKILAWADAHRARTGLWPIAKSGYVVEAPWETWYQIDDALRQGYRGCRPGGSLAKLLKKHRGKHPRRGYSRKPRLTIEQILSWADAFHERIGEWPIARSGRVAKGQSQTWLGVDHALQRGARGLPGNDSLARLLLRERGVARSTLRPRLTIKRILEWADAFHDRTGRWPSIRSGHVQDVEGERWASIDRALKIAARGLPAGYTLATLVVKYRGKRYRRALPPFTEAGILRWADAYHRVNGRWPTVHSGPISGTKGDTWRGVEAALLHAQRGLPGGESLSKFLMRHGRRPLREWHRHPSRHARLTVRLILSWADEFHRQHGRWPAPKSGPISGARDETWACVDNALRIGTRGLPGGSSVALLLEAHRGARHNKHLPPLTHRQILGWADAHQRRTGEWPRGHSGPIPGSRGETWRAVDSALHGGCRGFPGGDTLARLLRRRRGVPPGPRDRLRAARGRKQS